MPIPTKTSSSSSNYSILPGDSLPVLRSLETASVQCVVTSPPYYSLRDYGAEGQIGLEESPEEYVEKLVQVFREVRRVLRDDGTLWLNLGDTYASNGIYINKWYEDEKNQGKENYHSENKERYRDKKGFRGGEYKIKHKDVMGIPWRIAFALQADGWYLRQDIIWNKPSCMPEPVKDRCTKAHEYIFLLSKNPNYYYNHEAIMTPAKQEYKLAPGSNKPDPVNSAAYGMNQRRGSVGAKTSIRFGGNKYGNSEDPKHATKSGEYYVETGWANKRSVWTIPAARFSEAHFATFPEELAETCILAGSKPGDTVLDPFSGAATSGVVALKLLRNYVGIELNPEYCEMSRKRMEQAAAQNRLFV